MVGPWIYRLAADLTAERAERVRTQDRADVAAHLHDSVLQTLALIQKNAHDGPLVARLARSQERDLRAWLYSEESTDESTVAGRAARVAAARRGRPRRGRRAWSWSATATYDEPLRPVVRATGEAVTNAAKHAGVDRVDVYAEVTDEAVDVFVRDRGVGLRPVGGAARTATASATASATGWPATAGPPRSAPRPARAPRCGCTCRADRTTARRRR